MPQTKKEFDIKKAVKNDLTAAIALLDIIRSDEQLFNIVVDRLEEFRANAKKAEKKPEDV